MGILFFVIMMVIVFKMTGFILGIFGRLLGMFLSLMLHVLGRILAVAFFGAALIVIPIAIIVGICSLIFTGGQKMIL
ncbi:MAG: hypothetical protein II594_09450 [Clostridium sp.]|nr:hypothetical protein [Clostridium sp.]